MSNSAVSEGSLRYLALLKRCLTRRLFDENFERIPSNTKTPLRRIRSSLYAALNKALSPWRLAIVRTGGSTGETMLSDERLDNIQFCIESVVKENIPGDVIETGVWRGGATILMKAVLESLGARDRNVWVADSFQGLPRPNVAKFPADAGNVLWTRSHVDSSEVVRRNFERYDLLDEHVRFLVGFFADTLPSAPIERISVLRLDGDMYESTIQALDSLYDKVSTGGFIIVDDYGRFSGCKTAVDDFRAKRGIDSPMEVIDKAGVFWRKRASVDSKS